MSTAAVSLTSGERYVGYSYAYPHKTAYRPLAPARPLEEIWSSEPRDALFLYLHVPFCRVRCGFCNLFTTGDSDGGLVQRYLAALRREARAVSQALPGAGFVRIAVGGGTPTLLTAAELDQLFDLMASLGASPAMAPTSIEASPDTVTRDRLEVLRARGVSRLSVGVQTFDEQEAKAIGRPQRRGDAVRALELARQVGFAVLNIDLIYGGEVQTVASWLRSVREALAFEPEEIYLYPLYVRPLTGLGRRHGRGPGDDQRPAAYRAARDLLCSAGYTQLSMRMFRAARERETSGPSYCCQSDGMVGLGAGARSYTRALHYSTEYAVGRPGIQSIIEDYVRRDDAELGRASYGFALDAGERRRRWAIQSLLLCEGLDRAAYRRAFGTDVLADLPELEQLLAAGLASATTERLRLSDDGIERSDVIGPWLTSAEVRARMESYTWR
jgi:oxygen-independent coproporphyrinogen-3 oxidase